MAASDASPLPIKNQAYRVTFPILDADGDLVSGATGLDSEVSKDGGTFADCTNEATEIATSSGMYYLDLTSTEMNADTVAIIVKSSGKTTPLVLYPVTLSEAMLGVNTVQVGGTAQTAGDIIGDTNDIQARLPAALVGGRMDSSLGAVAAGVDLSATMKASVNAEVLDVLNVDTFGESASVPAATSTLIDKIKWLFTLARNKINQTSTAQTLRNDADSADIATSTDSDNGTTYTRGKWT